MTLQQIDPNDTAIQFETSDGSLFGLPASGTVRFQLKNGSSISVDIDAPADYITVRVTEADGRTAEHGQFLTIALHADDEIALSAR